MNNLLSVSAKAEHPNLKIRPRAKSKRRGERTPSNVRCAGPGPADPANTFLSGDIRLAVATALAAARGKNVNVIGADVARQCLEAGLVDEIVVFLAPVLLGEGVRLFQRPGRITVTLEPVSVTQSGRVTNLRFRVPKFGS